MDVVVVASSLASLGASFLNLNVIRMLRVMRVIRLFGRVKALKKVLLILCLHDTCIRFTQRDLCKMIRQTLLHLATLFVLPDTSHVPFLLAVLDLPDTGVQYYLILVVGNAYISLLSNRGSPHSVLFSVIGAELNIGFCLFL